MQVKSNLVIFNKASVQFFTDEELSARQLHPGNIVIRNIKEYTEVHPVLVNKLVAPDLLPQESVLSTSVPEKDQPFRLQHGKTYRTRNGLETFTVEHFSDYTYGGLFAATAAAAKVETIRAIPLIWTVDGRYFKNRTESGWALVKEEIV